MTEEGKKEKGGVGAPAAAIAAGLAVLFAMLNRDDVEVNWLIGTWQTPLIVVILVSLLLGTALGWALGRRKKD